MALEAASQLSEGMADISGFHLTNLQIERAMIIPSTAYGLEYSLNLKQVSGKSEAAPKWEFAIYSKQEDGPWIRHADGCIEIRRTGASPAPTRGYREKYLEIQGLCDKTLPPRQLYETLDVVGLNYGPCFQNVTSIATHRNSCISRVRISDTKSKMPANFEYPHIIHPATLDAMFQTLFAIESKPMVPSLIESIFVSSNIPHDIGHEFTGFATAERYGICDATGSIVMVSDTSNWEAPSVVVDGLRFTALSSPSIEDGGFIPNHRNLCSEIVWKEDYATSTVKDFTQMLSLMAHKYPSLSVLQCGGNENLAQHILETLSEGGVPRLSRYTFTDTQTLSAVKKTYEKLPVANLLEQRDWQDSKVHLARYNLIITAKDSGIDQMDANQLLLPQGLLLKEISPPLAPGSTESSSEPHRISKKPPLSCDLESQQFEAHLFVDKLDRVTETEVLIILPETVNSAMEDFVKSLTETFSNRGLGVSTGTLNETVPDGKACVCLLELCDSFVYNWTEKQFREFHHMQNTAKSLLWITRAANRRPVNARNAPIIALARTILSEDPQKTIVTLDLDENTSIASASLPKIVGSVVESMLAGFDEAEFAEEGGKLYIPRLMPLKELNMMIESESHVEIASQPIFDYSSAKNEYEMVLAKPGITNESFHFVENPLTHKLGPHEVEVQTLSAALQLGDLQTASGRTSDDKLGLDILGIVKNVGDKVTDFRYGDQVLAITPGAFKTVHRIHQGFVKHAPPPIDCCQYMPSALISAYYALCTVGRLSRKKRVLIHAGASSYGQAAIRIAIFLGAEVFVTVLGDRSHTQRATLLHNYHLPEDHILDANEDSFIAIILRSGKVDVLYNPTQEHTVANFKCVKACESMFLHGGTPPQQNIAQS